MAKGHGISEFYVLGVGLVLLLTNIGCSLEGSDSFVTKAEANTDSTNTAEKWRASAAAMVDYQIASREIVDERVLAAMKNTPRHLFVPDNMKRYAYEDRPLPIGHSQTISQPYIVALMTELLQLDTSDRVLEIGTGSGYQAAILAQLAGEVYSIEIVEALAKSSKKLLADMKHDNVTVIYGDGYQGLPGEAPFDKIIITAAPPEIPEKLVEQLKKGGIMVLPVGKLYQELLVINKQPDGSITKKSAGGVRFVPMVKPGE